MTIQPAPTIACLCLALFALAAGPASAQQYDPADPVPPDPAVTTGILANGLTYFIHENDEPENRAALRLVVNAGSILEDDDQLGLAHFVEHMAFNGTENFEKQELISYLESIGMRFGADLNAYTSFDETVYMLEVPMGDPEVLATAFQILADWAGGVTFDPEEVDSERGVVIEEWRLRRLGGVSRIQDEQRPVILNGSRYAERLPIGDPEILANAPVERLRSFYEDWYRPDLMSVIAVGDFDGDVIEAMIREHFEGLEGPDNPRPRNEADVPIDHPPLISMGTDPELPAAQVQVLYKRAESPRGAVADFRRVQVQALYAQMLNQRLSELTYQAEPPFADASAGVTNLVRGADVSEFSAVVAAGGYMRALDAVLTEVERVARHGFTAVELAREKASLRRSYERRLAEAGDRSSASLATRYTQAFLNGYPYPSVDTEVALLDAVLPAITLEETSALAGEWLTDEGRVVLVAGPERAGLDIPAEEEVTEVFAAVSVKEVEPYEAADLDVPLLADIPEGSPIVAEESVDEIGVTIWELANGVRVVLKPTGFSDDEIVFRGTSPGGTSLAPEEILGHVLPIQAVDIDLGGIVAEGGVGELGPVALNRHLSDKEASAAPFVGPLTEEIRGSASPRDMETALQLTYLRFTAPRMDEPVFQSLKSQIDLIANLGFLPSMVFQDTLAAYVGQGHPRGPQTLAQQVQDKRAAELDVAMEFYRDRFADASDFTFYFVGAFDLDGIRPLVETYLGGLPNLGRTEDWIDHGVDPPPGVIEKTIYKGIAPQSTTAIFFTGDGEFSREESVLITSMAEILQTRLRERLREELGGTYGVGVGGDIRYRPDEEYSVTIAFSSDPRRAEELSAAAFEEIERLKAEGPDAEVVANVREAQRRSKETNLEQNGYWLAQLSAHEDARLDIREIPSYDRIEGWTAEQVQQAANRYLRTDQFMKFVLLPEYMMPRARIATTSPVPVDVIPAGEFVNQGATDLADALRTLHPSFNVNTQPISGASTFARPANLRGLAPDHGLVLVNGKRRHRTAAIAWQGNGVADGAQGPDLSLIPGLALREAEILRDGAAPRHGSDAIAGVMNFALKNDRSGGTIEFRTGGHLLGDPGAPLERGVFSGDGEMHTVAGNVGLPIGQSGFLNLTGEYGNAMATDRSVQRSDALALVGSGNTSVREPAQIWGSPEVSDDIKLWANSGYSLLGGIAQLHFHGNYASRQVEGGSHFQNPNTRGGVFGTTNAAGEPILLIGDLLDAGDGVLDGSAGCPEVRVAGGVVADQEAWSQVLNDPDCFTFQKMFPGGLAPQVGAHLLDGSAVGGLRLNWGSLSLDASGGWGRSNLDFFAYNTVNASLGPDQPCRDKGTSPAIPDQPCTPYFNPGSYDQRETTVNVDLSYAKSETTNVAGGFEWRKEAFEIVEGDGASWTAGPLAAQGFTPGSNGFTGFGPLTAGTWDRTNVAAYGDIEFREADNNWLVDVGGRVENFSDFGLAASGRVAARLSLTGGFALRGAAGTGFRAPTPGQQNAFNISAIHEPGLMDPTNSGTIPSTSRVAERFGGEPIEPEKSVNASLGAAFGQGSFQLAADYFFVDVSDRLTISRSLEPTGADVDRLLDEGIIRSRGALDRFRFFTSDLATRTQGVDVVATYQMATGQGTTSLTSAWNRTITRVTRHDERTLSDLRIRILEEGLPGLRGNVSVNHALPGDTRALVRASYWGGYFDALTPYFESDASNTIDYPSRVLVDAEIAQTFMDRWTLTLGAQNVLNTVPEEYPGAADGLGNRYGPLTPFGFNGAFFYTRLTYNW